MTTKTQGLASKTPRTIDSRSRSKLIRAITVMITGAICWGLILLWLVVLAIQCGGLRYA